MDQRLLDRYFFKIFLIWQILGIASVGWADPVLVDPTMAGYSYNFLRLDEPISRSFEEGSVLLNIDLNYSPVLSWGQETDTSERQKFLHEYYKMGFSIASILNKNSYLGLRFSVLNTQRLNSPVTGLSDTQINYNYSFKNFFVQPGLFVPSGNTKTMSTYQTLSPALKLGYQKEFGNTLFNIFGSYQYIKDTDLFDKKIEEQILGGGGLSYRYKKFDFVLEGQYRSLSDYLLGDIAVGMNYRHGENSKFYGAFQFFGDNVFDDSAKQMFTLGYRFTPIIKKTTQELQGPGCFKNPRHLTYYARKLSSKEISGLTLPYVTSRENKISVLNIGEATAIFESGFPYVRDSNVVFAFDVPVKDLKEIKTLKNMSLVMDIIKSSYDAFDQTELLCFHNIKKCSGELFSHKDWQGNINKSFKKSFLIVNNKFSKDFVEKKYSSQLEKKVFRESVKLDLSSILSVNLNDVDNILNLKKKKGAFKTFYFSLSDDTYISSETKLIMNSEVEICQSGDPSLAP